MQYEWCVYIYYILYPTKTSYPLDLYTAFNPATTLLLYAISTCWAPFRCFRSNKKSQRTSLCRISLKVHLSLKTYAEPALHREGDVTEDGATCLRVFHRETLDVHLAPVGPVVLGMWIVNDEVRASFTAGFSRQQLLRREVDELEHSID